jgi:hypothetical protein
VYEAASFKSASRSFAILLFEDDGLVYERAQFDQATVLRQTGSERVAAENQPQ